MIALGTKISTDTETYAIAGAFVKDRRGNLLVMTSRQMLARGLQLQIIEPHCAIDIGNRTGGYFHQEGPADRALKLIGWFKAATSLAGGEVDLPLTYVQDGEPLLNRQVKIPALGQDTVGVVYSENAFARFQLEDAQGPVTITGLLKIGFDHGDEIGDREGSAGAAVMLDDALLGIVVGATGGDLLVAPINRLLEAESLQLATASDLQRHNMEYAEAEDQKQGKTGVIERIADAIGVAIPGPGSWDSILENWIVSSWQSHMDGKDGFAPYRSYFRSLQKNQNIFVQRLWAFGLDVLNKDPVTRNRWEDVLYRACAATGGANEAPVADAKSSAGVQGSHDLVARDEDQRNAA